MQDLLFEIFKRVVNNENLKDIVSDSVSNFDGQNALDLKLQSLNTGKILPPSDPLIPFYKTPQIRAQSIFVLSKHWKPFDPRTNLKEGGVVKNEEDGLEKIK